MKATVVKKAGKVVGVVIPNPAIKFSCTIVASKGMRVEEMELADDEAGNREQFVRHLKKVGVQVAQEAAPAPAKKSSKRR